MSTESISPVSFYALREFGYKRFEKVEPNNLDNRIILYDKYPVFSIKNNKLESYSIVIEIDKGSLNEDLVQKQSEAFFVNETIYLNPFTTKIYFCNEQEKISTLSKAEPSIETKMVSLYKNCFTVKPKNIDSFEWQKNTLNDISDNNISKYISKDRRINKLKGFLYAYILAANKSLSSDVVTLKKYAKELRNILSAVITSPDGKATYYQEEQLKSLYNAINEKFYTVYTTPILKEKAELYKCDFTNMLKDEELLEFWLQKHNYLEYHISKFDTPKENKDKVLDSYIQDFYNQIKILENSQRKLKIKNEELPTLQNCNVPKIPGEKKEFIAILFNKFLEEAYSSNEFLQSRYEFAKSGGKIFKEEIQDKWEGSTSQKYINNLLKNLNESSAFDIKGVDNLTLKSFAAFCKKGESDIDKLEDYLISNEIGDFRIAFSLWGIVFGFANMPKTLTNDLFLSDDLDYISDTYKYIYKQIHGIELNGTLERKQEKVSVITEAEPNTQQEIQSDDSKSQDIKSKLKDCNLKQNQLEQIEEIYKKNNGQLTEKFFAEIERIKGIGPKTIEKIKNALGFEIEKTKSRATQSELFDTEKPQVGIEFYNDIRAFSYIENLLPSKIKEKIKVDINWFQEEYKKGKNSNYYSKASRENLAVIEAFERYIQKKNYAKQLDIDNIISRLKSLYLQNE